MSVLIIELFFITSISSGLHLGVSHFSPCEIEIKIEIEIEISRLHSFISDLQPLGPYPWESQVYTAQASVESQNRGFYHCFIVQILQVVQAFVRQSMGYIEQTPDKESKLELIKTLQTVTEGKVTIPRLLISHARA